MAQNVTIAGRQYSAVPAIDVPKTGGGTATFTDVTDTTAAASDVAQGKYFFTASGVLTLGTATGGGGTGGVTQDANGYLVLDDQPGASITVEPITITQNGTTTAPTGKAYSPVTVNVSGGGGAAKKGVIRSDAELVQTYTYDKYIVEDEGIPIPAFTTTSTTLINTSTLGTVALDLDTYDYRVTLRGLATPVYNSQTPVAGLIPYWYTAGIAELIVYDPATFSYDGVNYPPSRSGFVNMTNYYMFPYFTSASVMNMALSQLLGPCVYYITAPSYSASGLTITSPRLTIRGSSTYFTSNAWRMMTDIRYQYVIEVYRAPKSAARGYAIGSQMYGIIGNINGDGKLT